MRPLSRTSNVFLFMILSQSFFSPSDRQYRRNNAFGYHSVRHGFDDRDGAVERLALSPRTSNIASSKQIRQSTCAMMNLSSLYGRDRLSFLMQTTSQRPSANIWGTYTHHDNCLRSSPSPPALWFFSSVAFVCFGFRFFFLFFSFSSIVFRAFGL